MDDLDRTERNRRAILHLSRACLKLAAVVGNMERKANNTGRSTALPQVDDPVQFIADSMHEINEAVTLLEGR